MAVGAVWLLRLLSAVITLQILTALRTRMNGIVNNDHVNYSRFTSFGVSSAVPQVGCGHPKHVNKGPRRLSELSRRELHLRIDQYRALIRSSHPLLSQGLQASSMSLSSLCVPVSYHGMSARAGSQSGRQKQGCLQALIVCTSSDTNHNQSRCQDNQYGVAKRLRHRKPRKVLSIFFVCNIWTHAHRDRVLG